MFQRQVFRRLFFSYIVIIFITFFVYTSFILYENNIISRERAERVCEMLSEEISSILRKRILNAQNIVLDLNYSSSLKQLYLSTVSGTLLDSYTLSSITNELKVTQTSSGLTVDGTIIFLNSGKKAYTSSGVISIDESFRDPDKPMPYITVGTVKDLLGFENNKRYSFNKDYLIYCDHYTYQNGTNIGLICILFNLDTLQSEIAKILRDGFGTKILLDGNEVFHAGNLNGKEYSNPSGRIPGITVMLYAPNSPLEEENLFLVIILLIIFLISVALIVLAYWFSRKYYQPIRHIENMVKTQSEGGDPSKVSFIEPTGSEMDEIIQGIKNLIGEKNKYREKMLTITPYAQTGMLHGVLIGNMENDTIRVLTEENYLDLIKPYFIVSVVNFVYQKPNASPEKRLLNLQDLLAKVCAFFSTDEIHLAYYTKDIYNAFLIANFENDRPMDEMFYQIHKFIQENVADDKFIVTMGVDSVKDDIGSLKDACEGALRALNEMITGGRGEVYFNESLQVHNLNYYFPAHFTDKLKKYILQGQIEEVEQVLDEIYRKNLDLGGTAEMYQALLDELHLSIFKALKEITDLNKTHVNIEKIYTTATLEEIFNYYKTALKSIIVSLQQEAAIKSEDSHLEENILNFIEENCCNPDISFQYLTDYFNVSSKYLSLFCKKYYNTTFHQYIQNKRIDRAKMLIKSGNHSLSQICSMCGYTNLLTFRRNFKSVAGVNPSEYLANE